MADFWSKSGGLLGQEWQAASVLPADTQSLDAQLTAPQLAIDANKIQGATAKATFSALNRFLKDDLRAGIELLKESDPKAYQALREASQVDDAAYWKRKGSKGKIMSLITTQHQPMPLDS